MVKLSEILKDWPNKYDTKNIDGEMESFNDALTSCDREIDREALAKVIINAIIPLKGKSPLEMQNDYHALEVKSRMIADRIISTMPTWLKRIEK